MRPRGALSGIGLHQEIDPISTAHNLSRLAKLLDVAANLANFVSGRFRAPFLLSVMLNSLITALAFSYLGETQHDLNSMRVIALRLVIFHFWGAFFGWSVSGAVGTRCLRWVKLRFSEGYFRFGITAARSAILRSHAPLSHELPVPQFQYYKRE